MPSSNNSVAPYLNALNADYIEELEKKYQHEPASLEPTWRYFFDGMNINALFADEKNQPTSQEELEFELKVIELIQGYREMGYLIADVNPLDRGTKNHPLLELKNFGLTEKDLDRVCRGGKLLGMGSVSLRTIIEALSTYYCSPVSVEYAHIEDPKSRLWIQERVESNMMSKPLDHNTKMQILQKLCEAECLETFLHKRFVGHKRFSVEGCDVIIPVLDYLIDQSSALGTEEIIVGMAHRGRLNVLTNIFQKNQEVMLAEFSGNLKASLGDGDVKYHMGFSQDIITRHGRPMHLSLMPNPSHLEAVNPVIMGVTRSKQKLKQDKQRMRTLPVLIHGDSSFSGQGIIYETLNMSELEGYTIGGTIHIILNNQVGFTTNPKDSRSTPQATDIAKMLEIPIFRINADEPEAALQCVHLALRFRHHFKRDVVLDIVGYRRWGHNESDEPSFTQPLMYKKINSHSRVREIYAQRLVHNKITSNDQVKRILEHYEKKLDEALEKSRSDTFSGHMHSFGDRWKGLTKPSNTEIFEPVKTGVNKQLLKDIAKELIRMPENFKIHPKLQRTLDDRNEIISEQKPVDWALAEALAFGSLITQGIPVRLAGQDSERGTFSHRHAVFHDIETGEKYCPLNNMTISKADFEVVNSPLSEYAALGFEFGQSITNPNKLTIWEAQFGDFINGAQIIVDQFITSSATKWQRYSGLVMLLPHGYEGQGPEHSSARVERFLQACANDNIQVCNVTTPAQYFHVLRRQLLRHFRIPLIIMTPKSLLRHGRVISSFDDLESGCFQEILDDRKKGIHETAHRLVLCTGKIYFELQNHRASSKLDHTAIVRIEQIYPFPHDRLKRILEKYPRVTEIVWVQEEPKNMGAWTFMLQALVPLMKKNQTLSYIGRAPQASTADGHMHLHHEEQKRITMEGLGES